MAFVNICGRDIRVGGRIIRIGRLEADKYRYLEDPEPVLDVLRQHKDRVDLFTFLQRPPETSPRYSYPMEWDNLAVLPVSTYEHWLTQQIRFAPRGRVRQAEKKGVVAREVPFDDALIRGIWEIYNECPIRQGGRFNHYGMSLDGVRNHARTFLDSSIFIGAFLGEKLIGFAKLTCDETRTIANLMHILSMVKHNDKCPTNALIAQAVRTCAARRIPHLAYQNFSYGQKGLDGLSNFKKVNGFQEVRLPRYFVPLTALGSIALRLRLHHRFIDHVPRFVLVKAREFRSAWNQRKFQSITQSS